MELDEQRVRPALSEVERLISSPERAKALTGWEPQVDLREGSRRTIEWLQVHAARVARDGLRRLMRAWLLVALRSCAGRRPDRARRRRRSPRPATASRRSPTRTTSPPPTRTSSRVFFRFDAAQATANLVLEARPPR